MKQFYERIKTIFGKPVYQVAFILFVFEVAFMPTFSQPGDSWAFFVWCRDIYEHGIGNIYKYEGFNYPPLISYFLFLFGWLQGSANNISHYFYFFKTFGLLADFIVTISLINLLWDEKKNIIWLLLLIANPAFIYNSYCWGQVDGVLTLFIFASFLCILKGKLPASIIFFTLAVNFKVHAIIFLPPLVLVAFFKPVRLTLSTVFWSMAAVALTETVILLPFIASGQVQTVGKAMLNSVGYYQCITCNAYNSWFFFVGGRNMWSPDMGKWAGVPYRYWGLAMFFIFSSITLLPAFLSALSVVIKKNIFRIDMSSLFISFALVSLLFFYFNTQMHERFGHSALIFIAAFAFSSRRYWVFALACAAYFGNMEGICHFFNFPNYGVLIFNPYWVASLYAVLIVFLFYYLYKPFISQLKANYGR